MKLQSVSALCIAGLGLILSASLGCTSLDSKSGDSARQSPLFPPGSALPVLQGLTSESAALLNVIADVNDKIELKIEGGDPETRIEWREVSWPKATEKVVRARATGLRVGQSYQLIVYRNQQLVDRREFRALDSQSSQFRLLIGSCMNDEEKPEEIERIWAMAKQRAPTALFLIGDNVYADLVEGKYRAPADGTQLWRRYAETMARLPLYRWKRLVPVLATWDDHDFGVNDGDRSHPFKEEARQVFLSFFPQEHGFTDNWISGPGVSSRWTAFGAVFHFLDARSFRSPRGEAAGSPELQTQLGTEQENWVLQGLDSHRVNYLIKGDQWWGAYHRFESYEGSHPVSFKKWLKRLSDSAAPTLMISGDRHLSEVMKIPQDVLGYETYELTTSPVHARKYSGDWDKAPNPRQVHGIALANNWLELELVTRLERSKSGKPLTKYFPQLQLRYWSEAGELYSQAITLPRRLAQRRTPPAPIATPTSRTSP